MPLESSTAEAYLSLASPALMEIDAKLHNEKALKIVRNEELARGATALQKVAKIAPKFTSEAGRMQEEDASAALKVARTIKADI